jgi:signal transduction histidine kinase
LGQPVELLIPPQFRDRHQTYSNSFAQHLQDQIVRAGRDLYARKKNKSEFPVEISLSHYQHAGEHFVIAFVLDISIRKRDEMQLLQQKQKLEVVSAQVQAMNTELERKVEARTNMLKETLAELETSKEELRVALEKERELGELKSRFVTMASHEFRTPLSAILTSSYIIQQYTSSEDQEKRERHLVKIQNAVQNLTFILEDFLSLEKLEEGQVQVKPQEITPEELVAEIESIAEEMKNILKKGQYIEFKHAVLPQIITDKNLLRNILVNLISNAIKYSAEQSPISIDALGENGYLKISVIDRGIGIPQADQKHLFERFFRAGNVSTTQGTGLGLHIVNRYLKLIQGDISMKSEINQGTTFTIVLNNAPTQ